MMHADFNWLGLLFIFGGLAYNFWKSMDRGKVESEEEAAQPRRPAAPSTPSNLPERKKPLTGKSLEEVFAELSKGLEPVPPSLPPPVPHRRPTPLPPIVIQRKEPQSSELQDDPSGLLERSGEALYSTAIEKMDPTEEVIPSPKPILEDSNRFAWLRQRLSNREETQRCIILNEVFQPPVAMR